MSKHDDHDSHSTVQDEYDVLCAEVAADLELREATSTYAAGLVVRDVAASSLTLDELQRRTAALREMLAKELDEQLLKALNQPARTGRFLIAEAERLRRRLQQPPPPWRIQGPPNQQKDDTE